MVDIAKQKDKRGIFLDEVGVTGLILPIKVKDRATGKFQSSTGTFDAYVSLADDQKGTHMSRIVEAIYKYRDNINQHELTDMAEYLKDNLHAKSSRVTVKFPYFIERKSPVSGLLNLMTYHVKFTATSNEITQFILGADVDIMTVCPCAKEECGDGSSHVQRGILSINIVPKKNEWIWLEDLINIAEMAASSPVYDRLKRPDEKFVVQAGFDNPKFVEDVVRDATVLLETLLPNKYTSSRISCENQESIHAHNCRATKLFNWHLQYK